MATARKRKGWTQEDLAAHAKIDQSTISRIERGVVSPTSAHLVLLAELLGVEPAKLLKQDDDEPGNDSVTQRSA